MCQQNSDFKLYSYVVRYDLGSAPNPYWGICTLAICKPVIRRTAKVGDYIIGTGSANSVVSNKAVYIMKITDKKTMHEYSLYTINSLHNKIPIWNSSDYLMRVGDSIYIFENEIDANPKIRKSVHNELNRARDLSGQNVLLSTDFIYFGNNAIEIPTDLKGFIHTGQGHRSQANNNLRCDFEKWYIELKKSYCCIIGEPIDKTKVSNADCPQCCDHEDDNNYTETTCQ